MTSQDLDILFKIIAGVVFIFTFCSLPTLIDHYGWGDMRLFRFLPRFNLLGRVYLFLILFGLVFWSFVYLLII